MSDTVDSVIMKEVAKIVTSPSGGIRDFANAIVPKIPAILLMVLVKKCLENAGDAIYNGCVWVWSCFKRLLYSELAIDTSASAETPSYHLVNVIKNRWGTTSDYWFPMYYRAPLEGSKLSYLQYFNPLHKSVVDGYQQEADQLHTEHLSAKNNNQTIYKKLLQSGNILAYAKTDYSKLYPSTNYMKLVEVIQSHFEVSRLVGAQSVLGMLIDGVPGLGKTRFADYATEIGLAGYIYKVDMTTMLHVSFDELIKTMYHGIAITTPTIFVVDEIDKYLDYRIDIEYEVMMTNAMLQNDKSVNVVDKKEHHERCKTKFLYQLLSMLERDGLQHSIVLIFCSNNFASIFEGVDLTHHTSLYDRFMKIHFDQCDHKEIVSYLTYYNTKFVGTRFWCSATTEELSNTLRPDVEITHRVLHHISVQAKYNALAIIKLLNMHTPDELEKKVASYKISPSKAVICPDTTSITSVKSTSKLSPLIVTPKNQPKNYVIQLDFSDKEESSESEERSPITKTLAIRGDGSSNDSDEDDKDQGLWGVVAEDMTESNKLWEELYVKKCPAISLEEMKHCCVEIKRLLNAVEGTRDKVRQDSCIDLLTYIAIEGYTVMVANEKFKSTVVNKIHEFRTFPKLNERFSPELKQFIFAAAGITC